MTMRCLHIPAPAHVHGTCRHRNETATSPEKNKKSKHKPLSILYHLNSFGISFLAPSVLRCYCLCGVKKSYIMVKYFVDSEPMNECAAVSLHKISGVDKYCSDSLLLLRGECCGVSTAPVVADSTE